jgi:hypothetical protein
MLTFVVVLRPLDCGVKVAFQMNDRCLTAAVGDVGVVAAVKQEEHHRSWAK